MQTSHSDEKLLSARVMWSYGVGDFAPSLSYAVLNTFLLQYLVNVVTLPPLVAGFVVISGRIIDAVSDPIMGWWLDWQQQHLRWIRLGMIPFGISFAVIWLLGDFAESPTVVLASLSVLLVSLHFLVFTFVQVPYTAITPLLATDYHARTKLTAYRVGFSTVASMVGVALPPLLVALLGGWLPMGVGCGVVMVFCYGLCVVGLRAVVALAYKPKASFLQSEKRNNQQDNSQLNPWQSWKKAGQTYGFISLLFIFALVTMGMGVVTSILPFFLEVLRLEPLQQTIVLAELFGVGIVSLPFWIWLSSRLGKRRSFMLGLLNLVVVLPLLVFTTSMAGSTEMTALSKSFSPLLLLWVALAALSVGALLLFPWSMLPDVLEFAEYKTGIRQEGSVYSIFTFVQKLAAAFGIGFNALLLSLVGYQAGGEQAAQVGIKWSLAGVASAFFLLAIVVLWRYPITRARHEQIQQELNQAANQSEENNESL